MSDPTDLSKLSSTEIIAKIVNLALDCDGAWTSEADAKLHVLTVVFKQVVIREAQVATVILPELQPGESISLLNLQEPSAAGTYYLVRKEIT
jgi:hypothetical protein